MAKKPKLKANLVDSSFDCPSFTMAGENSAEAPRLMEWDRSCESVGPTFFTDKELPQAVGYDGGGWPKVALLIEPPSLSQEHYQVVWRLRAHFDFILTFDSRYSEMGLPGFLWYPLGGSWIPKDKWATGGDKPKEISIIASQKRGAVGHQQRERVMKAFPEIDAFGRGHNPIESKVDGLGPYRLSVVVESIKIPGYFSEKLIDCLAVGTIPLYWGDPTIRRVFDQGIIPWSSIEQLKAIIRKGVKVHPQVIEMNKRLALAYRCAEDYIAQRYGKLLFAPITVQRTVLDAAQRRRLSRSLREMEKNG